MRIRNKQKQKIAVTFTKTSMQTVVKKVYVEIQDLLLISRDSYIQGTPTTLRRTFRDVGAGQDPAGVCLKRGFI